MEPPHGRIVEAKLDHPSRPRRASYLLRGVCLVGGGNGTDPEIWDDGEIADRLSHAVPLFGPRKPAGGADDAHRIGVWVHARKSQPDFGAVAGPTASP